jgi:YVTN family beta-propeller protein
LKHLALLALASLAFGQYPPNRVSTTAEPPTLNRVDAIGRLLTDLLPASADYEQTDVDPGVEPEGDYLGFSAFTHDGAQVWLTNRGTDNITVFDWATMRQETTFTVGDYPGGIAITDSFAVVTLGFVDSVVILRVSDYSVAARLPSGGQPWVVVASPDGRYAYVGCDISNTCEVYDLQALSRSRTIAGFPVFLSTYSWNSENGRNAFTFSEFVVTPDGGHIIVPNYTDTLFFINTATGAYDDTITGVGKCRFVELSGDGLKALVVAESSSGCIARRVDLATRAVDRSVTLPGLTLMTFEAAMNADGSKCYLGVSGNQSALVRFNSGDFITFTSTYTAFWVGVSPDHARAVSGQNNWSIIDFATETILGQSIGNPQSVGAVSRVGNRAVGYDPHRHEGLYLYDFSTPGPSMYRGTTNAGKDPEGDCPHRIAVAPDGSKAIVADVLSDNVSIVDVPTRTLDTIIRTQDRPQEVAVTSDSRWGVVANVGETVSIIDLVSGTTAATVQCPGGPWSLALAPTDSFAYVGNISGNTVGIVRLDGAASQLVTAVPCGEIGVVWGAQGIASGVACSPDGRWVLVAVSFEDVVRVIDAHTYAVVATLTVGDFPLRIAFDASGTRAVVSNYFSNNLSLLYVDGANSSVIGTFACGQYPASVAYDPVNDHFAVGALSGKTVTVVTADSGRTVSTRYYTSYGSLNQVLFDETGEPVVLTTATSNDPGHVHRQGEAVVMPANPKTFDYCPAARTAVVAMPGPDWVTVVDWTPQGTAEVTPVRRRPTALTVRPAIASNTARIELSIPLSVASRFDLWDAAGRAVRSWRAAGGASSLSLDLAGLAAGVYLVREFGTGRAARVVITR